MTPGNASNVVVSQINERAPDTYDIKFSLSQQSQGIATRPDQDELMTYINDFLQRKKESGELSALHEEWVGAPLPDFVGKAE